MRPTHLLVICLAVCAGACGSADPSPVKADYDPQTGKLKTMTRDLNGDGKIDEWVYWNGAVAIRGEFDKDLDGKLDRWEYFADGDVTKLTKVGISIKKNGKEDAWAYSGSDGQVARLEISAKQDGKITRWEYYEGGKLVQAEEDTKGTGKPDKWETFTGGSLATLGLDADGDGKIDRLLTYGPNGVTVTRPDGVKK